MSSCAHLQRHRDRHNRNGDVSPQVSYSWRVKGSAEEGGEDGPPSANGSANGATNGSVRGGINGSMRSGKPPLGANRGEKHCQWFGVRDSRLKHQWQPPQRQPAWRHQRQHVRRKADHGKQYLEELAYLFNVTNASGKLPLQVACEPLLRS